MRYLSLLAVLLGTLAPAVAQNVDLRYYPLEVGDTWTYGASESRCSGPPGPDTCTYSQWLVRRTIVGVVDIEEEGIRYAEMEASRLDRGTGQVVCTMTWTVRIVGEYVGFEPMSGSCDGTLASSYYGTTEDEIPLTIGTPEPSQVPIGGLYYDLTTRSGSRYAASAEVDIVLARDVGLIFSHAYSDFGPGDAYGGFTLFRAEVGGVVYGPPPVASEEEAAPVAFRLAEVYPNPFSTTATILLSLPAPEQVTLAVFDVLGRRVLSRALGVQAAGESRHVLDGTGLPAGVYFVRATTASGGQATRRVARVE